MATPTYNVRERQRVVNQNLRPLRHPYFSAYTDLQKICLRILRHESLKYGQEKDKVYGILFDGAWLWEEYLYTILKECGFRHPENKKHKGGFPMFEKQSDDDAISKNSRRLYPDFWKDNFILDAKYKHLNYGVGREDLYQVVTYMYCRKATNGAYVYPFEQELDTTSYELNKTFGYGGYIHVIPFYVPQQCKSWEEFLKKIINCEKNLVEKV
jgi:5-methylcytosine-specific restriction endonuclease McrBC regulatory subunit McrC